MVYQRINLKSTRIPALAMIGKRMGLVVKNSRSKNPIRKQGLKFVDLAARCHDRLLVEIQQHHDHNNECYLK